MAIRSIDGYDDDGNPLTRIVDETNVKAIVAKARQALVSNATYLALPAIPAGTLTAAQLSTIVRQLRDQLDVVTRQDNAIIRVLLGAVDDITDT